MRSDWDRLSDISEQIDLILEDAALGRPRFDQDRHVRDSVVLRIANIGEACRALTESFRNSHPEIPWKDIIGMRTKLIHEYFEINRDEVWNTAARDIPDLKLKIHDLLAKREN